ncbi:MAG: purine-nucleoside phosphorylase [Cytophagales bacterium]
MTLKEIKESLDFIQKKIEFKPEFGIILGTGLGALAKEIIKELEINYKDIPHFPVSTVESHTGKLIFGYLSGKKVVVMQGRFHYYEGYSMQQIVLPVRVMKMLGIKTLFVSNASGGLNPDYQVSDLMILNDHINLLPENPLRGPNIDELGVRFPDLSNVYEKKLIQRALQISTDFEINVHEGIYAAVQGPTLETPAEYRYIRIIGADAVGMSTIPEVIVAHQMGIPVFAISVITDMGVPGMIEKVTIEKVLAAAAKAEPFMTLILKELIREA